MDPVSTRRYHAAQLRRTLDDPPPVSEFACDCDDPPPPSGLAEDTDEHEPDGCPWCEALAVTS